jgi:phosphoribosylformylglycinamidine cyclo-ligase
VGKQYNLAGVNIAKGEEAVRLIKEKVVSTYDDNVVSSLKQFAGIYKHGDGFLVSATDGVGTKLDLAAELNNHRTIGIDLVAMSVNDIIVHGAKPLFFLDYLATGKLDPAKVADVVSGITDGCREAGCVLLGGETAEMPGFYGAGRYDLAGFAVGTATAESLILNREITEGLDIIGIASSGPHSNGYSLVRKIIADNKLDLEESYGLSNSLGEALLRPTVIYSGVPGLLGDNILALAHITGGGFYQNIARILPDDIDASIYSGRWEVPEIFGLLQKYGGVSEEEMFEVFNMGIGMAAVVKDGNRAIECLQPKFKASLIGKTVSGEGRVIVE